MSEIFFASILAVFWFLLGFFIGNLNGKKKDVKEFTDETGRRIMIEAKKLIPTPSIPTGRIKPKSAEEIRKLNMNPQRREALDEVSKTLDKIPELVAAKELAALMRKEQYEGTN